jgi:hypothetical protein
MGSVWQHQPLLGSLLLRPGAACLDIHDRHTVARTQPDPRLWAQFPAYINLKSGDRHTTGKDILTKRPHRSFCIIVHIQKS